MIYICCAILALTKRDTCSTSLTFKVLLNPCLFATNCGKLDKAKTKSRLCGKGRKDIIDNNMKRIEKAGYQNEVWNVVNDIKKPRADGDEIADIFNNV